MFTNLILVLYNNIIIQIEMHFYKTNTNFLQEYYYCKHYIIQIHCLQ